MALIRTCPSIAISCTHDCFGFRVVCGSPRSSLENFGLFAYALRVSFVQGVRTTSVSSGCSSDLVVTTEIMIMYYLYSAGAALTSSVFYFLSTSCQTRAWSAMERTSSTYAALLLGLFQCLSFTANRSSSRTGISEIPRTILRSKNGPSLLRPATLAE